MGPSGSGKTSVVDYLCKTYGYIPVISYTTREPRYKGELGHYFVTSEQFKGLGKLCAYTMFDGNEYGVTEDIIDKSDLYIIDPRGVEYLRNTYRGSKSIVVIGLSTDEQECKRRMLNRHDSLDSINRRIEHDKKEFCNLDTVCDELVFSDSSQSVEVTAEIVHEIIRSYEP